MLRIKKCFLALAALLVLAAGQASAAVLVKNVNGGIVYNISATVSGGDKIKTVRVVIFTPSGELPAINHSLTPAATVSVSGSYKPTVSGSYSVVAYAKTVSGVEATSGTGRVAVNNNAPEIQTWTASLSTVNMGEGFTLTVAASDPDSNLSNVRLYRQSPPPQYRDMGVSGGNSSQTRKYEEDESERPYVEIESYNSLDSISVATTVTATIPTNRSGVYNFKVVVTDAEGMESELVIPVTAINPTRTMAVKTKTIVKPEFEGWFTDSEVAERTVEVRKYREDYIAD